jgi:GNAT superfamily N-acetyltransferase
MKFNNKDIIPVTIDLASQLQELFNEWNYVFPKKSGLFEIIDAQSFINHPQCPRNGRPENTRISCIIEDKKMIHFCNYYIGYRNDSIYLGDFYIAKNKRGIGNGRAIIKTYEEIWKNQGMKKVVLNVDLRNWAGIRFWFRNGYSNIVGWLGDNNYTENANAMLRLEKQLIDNMK